MVCRFEPWTLEAATAWFRDVADAAQAAGWWVSIGGSVVKHGEGVDLDVLAMTGGDEYTDLVEIWDARWHVIRAEDAYAPRFRGRVYATADMRVLDVLFVELT